MNFGIKKIFLRRNKGDKYNIILTGIPRSGTTLACKLLCDAPNTIALNEPMEGHLFNSKKEAVRNIGNAFKNFRGRLLKKEKP